MREPIEPALLLTDERLADKKLRKEARFAFLQLHQYVVERTGDWLVADVSMRRLAAALGMSRTSTYNAIKILARAGVLRQARQVTGEGTRTVFLVARMGRDGLELSEMPDARAFEDPELRTESHTEDGIRYAGQSPELRTESGMPDMCEPDYVRNSGRNPGCRTIGATQNHGRGEAEIAAKTPYSGSETPESPWSKNGSPYWNYTNYDWTSESVTIEDSRGSSSERSERIAHASSENKAPKGAAHSARLKSQNLNPTKSESGAPAPAIANEKPRAAKDPPRPRKPAVNDQLIDAVIEGFNVEARALGREELPAEGGHRRIIEKATQRERATVEQWLKRIKNHADAIRWKLDSADFFNIPYLASANGWQVRANAPVPRKKRFIASGNYDAARAEAAKAAAAKKTAGADPTPTDGLDPSEETERPF